ncbi:MAG: hypothetical protein ACFFD4_08070 [Candidatus Odinarchaeota archaeon]
MEENMYDNGRKLQAISRQVICSKVQFFEIFPNFIESKLEYEYFFQK